MTKNVYLATAFAALLGVSQETHAGMIGFSWTISGGNSNVPTMTLTNTSSSAQITNYSVTIGNTAYNWDAATVQSAAGMTPTLTVPDTNGNGGLRSDSIVYSFSGFDPTEIFSHTGDVDIDSSDTLENYKTVLFNNGSAPNSVVSVTFDTSQVLSATLPDASQGLSSYTVGASAASNAVPEPASVAMWGLGAIGLTCYGRRKRKHAA